MTIYDSALNLILIKGEMERLDNQFMNQIYIKIWIAPREQRAWAIITLDCFVNLVSEKCFFDVILPLCFVFNKIHADFSNQVR